VQDGQQDMCKKKDTESEDEKFAKCIPATGF